MVVFSDTVMVVPLAKKSTASESFSVLMVWPWKTKPPSFNLVGEEVELPWGMIAVTVPLTLTTRIAPCASSVAVAAGFFEAAGSLDGAGCSARAGVVEMANHARTEKVARVIVFILILLATISRRSKEIFLR